MPLAVLPAVPGQSSIMVGLGGRLGAMGAVEVVELAALMELVAQAQRMLLMAGPVVGETETTLRLAGRRERRSRAITDQMVGQGKMALLAVQDKLAGQALAEPVRTVLVAAAALAMLLVPPIAGAMAEMVWSGSRRVVAEAAAAPVLAY
jgi:hypothetical protein